MKILEVIIEPEGPFGTPLKGDTIFGQLCWQIFYDPKLAGKTLQELIASYSEAPFAVLSSAYPVLYEGGSRKDENRRYALKTPVLPSWQLFEFNGDGKDIVSRRKEIKARKWMIAGQEGGLEDLKKARYLDDKQLLAEIIKYVPETRMPVVRKRSSKSPLIVFEQFHNTINRLEGKTGEAPFTPFGLRSISYLPGMELVIFAGVDETQVSVEGVIEGLARIGKTGFGRDSSTGAGRFRIVSHREINMKKTGTKDANACYTLGPSVPEKNGGRSCFSKIYFNVFTRFGRHGDFLAKSSNPFKNPVIMADEGAVYHVSEKKVFEKSYIGRSLTGLSKVEPMTVGQGYSLYIPIKINI